MIEASAHDFPKFALQLSKHFRELRKVMSTSKFIDSSAVFLFEVPEQNSPLVVRELQIGGTSAHFPKFALQLSKHFRELRKVMSTSKFIDSSAAFLFEVPEQNSPLVVRELQIGGTSGPFNKEWIAKPVAPVDRVPRTHPNALCSMSRAGRGFFPVSG
jgi:hypothetical protein